GKLIHGLGPLVGVARNDDGRVILVGGKDTGVLPPLPIDDVVALFRAAYANRPPYVSVDPDPADPAGPRMLVRYDTRYDPATGTGGRYNWVLFECDRVMKGYFCGYDNVTEARVTSKVD